jgi:hypothetical protein
MPDGRPFDEYTFRCQAGKVAQIDVTSTQHDPYVLVRNASGVELGHDDDGGGLANARLALQCNRDVDLQAVVTISAAGGNVGAYRVRLSIH